MSFNYDRDRELQEDRPGGRVLAERSVRARKTHTCQACHKPIHVGELYHVNVSLIDGDLRVYRAHGALGWCAHEEKPATRRNRHERQLRERFGIR